MENISKLDDSGVHLDAISPLLDQMYWSDFVLAREEEEDKCGQNLSNFDHIFYVDGTNNKTI